MSSITVETIVDLYDTWGGGSYDEEVSQLAHARQCAALAARDGADEALCIAALLHDIGHLFEMAKNNGPDRFADLRHEQLGAAYLAELFPRDVTNPIALHVDAKRYLTATDSDYQERLSSGSQRSLELQGGPFSPEESASFIALDNSIEAVRLRRWDDHGKVIGLEVPEFDSWIPMMRRVASS